MIDIYEAEAGSEEGWGHANFDQTIYVAAVNTAWASFRITLPASSRKTNLSYDLSEHPPLAALVEEDVGTWDRRFETIEKRYGDLAGIPLAQRRRGPARAQAAQRSSSQPRPVHQGIPQDEARLSADQGRPSRRHAARRQHGADRPRGHSIVVQHGPTQWLHSCSRLRQRSLEAIGKA
jgi:hypothetical protein